MAEIFVPRSMEEMALTWPAELDHISASSLKMACRCPEQWRQVYVKGRRIRPNAAMLAGSADHAAIEHSMVQKITSHVDLPTIDVVEKFVEELDRRVDEVGIDELEVKKRSEKLRSVNEKKAELGKIKDAGTIFVGSYHNQVSPTIQPETVEEEFVLQPAGFPVKVVGRIDLVGTVNQSAPRIIDRKRRGSFNKKPEPEWVVQGRIYQLAREIPHEWHITFTKNGSIQAGGDAYTIEPDPRWKSEKLLGHVVGEIGYYMQRYGPDEPWPARGQLHTWACNYCAFKDDGSCWVYSQGGK